MKANMHKNTTFTPITVTFTIESKAELTALFHRLHLGEGRIIEAFFDENHVSRKQLDFQHTKTLHDVIKDALSLSLGYRE
jgi:hypothetical protein